VANELLARVEASTAPTYLMGVKDAAQLVGVSDLWFMLWQARTFTTARTRVDLRDLWSVLRWATRAQLRCFDLVRTAPRAVSEDGVEFFDLIDVLEDNGWTVPTRLRAA
jgi:hypothetical protein